MDRSALPFSEPTSFALPQNSTSTLRLSIRMCGIAGILTLERPVDAELLSGVLRMLDYQAQRGPDDWGILIPEEALRVSRVRSLLAHFDRAHIRTYKATAATPAAVLGARRLSIIDLSPRGRMPMGNTDGSLWVTYNGEIYNYRELRIELERRGYAFQSDTDTETILLGYQEWGEEVIQHLRGMFAFAILDVRKPDEPKIFLAKDRFGIKPLYWARRKGVFHFASEVRALMACGLMPNEPEHRGFQGFLTYGSVPAPFTTVRDVFSLPAAHTMTINALTYSYPKPHRYWSIPKGNTISIDSRSAVSETRRLLEESVRMHLVSDVPLGVFLSGGLDSSAITALAARNLSHPLTTLCVTFDDAEFSEGSHAARVASRFGCRHIDFRLKAEQFMDEIPRVMAAMDQPSIDGVNTYFVAKAARMAGLTVVLSGVGGDEIFWGYPGHRLGPRLSRWAKLPGVRLGAAMISALGNHFAIERAARLEFLREADPVGVYLTVRGLFSPTHAAQILGSRTLPLSKPALQGEASNSEYADLEILLYLQNQLLRDTDVFGMAHSLEIRVPFLDHRLAEFVTALPDSLKIPGDANKPLLAAALGDELGSEITTRRKMGFVLPLQRWLLRYQPALSEPTQDSSLNGAQVQATWKAFGEGRIHWSRPWALAVLEKMNRLGGLPRRQKQNTPKRILFLLPDVYSSKGGIAVYNQNLLRAIGEVFPHSELCVISVNDAAIDPESPAYGRLHFTGCGPRSSSFLKTRVAISSLSEALRHSPDLLICGHLNLGPLAVLLSALCGSNTALLAHGIEAWNPNTIHRWAARHIKFVLPVSSFTTDRMARWGIKRERIRILPDTVDGEVFRPLFRRNGTHKRLLLTVARLVSSDRYKGVDAVIRALPEVLTHHPGLRYVVAGTGDDVPRLMTLAKAAGVEDRVEFKGFVSQELLPALYGEADLFVMPSQKEGFGIVFLEALACGVPVIAGNSDGSEDALLGGKVGLFVDPEDSTQLARNIIEFLDGRVDKALYDPARLRNLTLEHYGFDHFRERVRTVFLEAWGGKPLLECATTFDRTLPSPGVHP